jgi:hypothetical protein
MYYRRVTPTSPKRPTYVWKPKVAPSFAPWCEKFPPNAFQLAMNLQDAKNGPLLYPDDPYRLICYNRNWRRWVQRKISHKQTMQCNWCDQTCLSDSGSRWGMCILYETVPNGLIGDGWSNKLEGFQLKTLIHLVKVYKSGKGLFVYSLTNPIKEKHVYRMIPGLFCSECEAKMLSWILNIDE